jgi:long-subunit fatty acid transport protein
MKHIYEISRLFPIISLLTIFSVTRINGQELSGISASFVDLGFGARPAAMGNAYVAASDDANSVFWNPAGITSASAIAFEFNYLNQLQLVPYSAFAGVIPLSEGKDGLGVGLIYSGDDAMKEFTFLASYARKFGKLNIGATAKYRYASFGNNTFNADDYTVFDPGEIQTGEATQVFGNGNGFGFDVGAIYELNEEINVGLVLKDLFAPFRWSSDTKSETQKPQGDYDESMPINIVAGVAFRPVRSFRMNIDYRPPVLLDTYNVFRLGAEYTFMNVFSLRAGTQQTINSLDDEKYNFGVGVRYSFGGITAEANYAYVIEELGNTSRFALGIKLK